MTYLTSWEYRRLPFVNLDPCDITAKPCKFKVDRLVYLLSVLMINQLVDIYDHLFVGFDGSLNTHPLSQALGNASNLGDV